MSCYFRYLKDLFAEAGIRVAPKKKREIDQAIHPVPRKPRLSRWGGSGAYPGGRFPEAMAVKPWDGVHAWARVPYKRCMPDCWSKVKSVLHDSSKHSTLIAALKRLS